MKIDIQDGAARALIREAADHQEALGGGSVLEDALTALLDAMLDAERAGTNVTHSQARTLIRQSVADGIPDSCRDDLAWACEGLN